MGNFLQKESWSFALLATSKRRRGVLYFVNFQMTGVWCAFVIPKRQKLSLNLWGGGQGVVFSHSSPPFLSPTPFLPSPFFLLALSPVSLIFSPPLSILLPLLSPTPCLPSPFPPHLCGHDCCEYHTHICVAQGWKFNILVAQCYTYMIKQECWKIVTPLKF